MARSDLSGAPLTTSLLSSSAAALSLAASVSAQPNLVIINDDFTSLNTAIWGPATNGPWQAGAPDHTMVTEIQGRSVLRMESRLTGPERRGYLSTPPFPLRSALIEAAFSPLEGDGAPLELWLLFPYGDAFIALSPYASAPGQNVARLQTTGAVHIYGPPPIWRHGSWYRCVLDVRGRSVRASLLDEAGAAIWTQTYPWSLCNVAPEWGVGFVQFRESGAGRAVAAIDRFRVTLRCSADVNEDDLLTPADFVAFVLAWNARDCVADVDSDLSYTINDFVAFQRAFAAGCL